MNSKQMIKAIEKMGWYEVATRRGTDHIKFKNEQGRMTIIPYKGAKQLAPGTISAICKQVGVDKKALIKYI